MICLICDNNRAETRLLFDASVPPPITPQVEGTHHAHEHHPREIGRGTHLAPLARSCKVGARRRRERLPPLQPVVDKRVDAVGDECHLRRITMFEPESRVSLGRAGILGREACTAGGDPTTWTLGDSGRGVAAARRASVGRMPHRADRPRAFDRQDKARDHPLTVRTPAAREGVVERARKAGARGDRHLEQLELVERR